jgi:hypothetical protein
MGGLTAIKPPMRRPTFPAITWSTPDWLDNHLQNDDEHSERRYMSNAKHTYAEELERAVVHELISNEYVASLVCKNLNVRVRT